MADAREIYGSIIDLEHHEPSSAHPRMSRAARAAQFAPFAALTGYDELIREASRMTEERRELDESEIDEIDRKLRALMSSPGPHRAVFLCFVPDGRKSGGKYAEIAGTVLRYDEACRSFILKSGETVYAGDIADVRIPEEN